MATLAAISFYQTIVDEEEFAIAAIERGSLRLGNARINVLSATNHIKEESEIYTESLLSA